MKSDVVSGEISGFTHVWQPGEAGGRAQPTLLLLHGTGGDEYDLLGLGHALSPSASLLSPRGRVLEGGRSNRFFRRLAEGVFDTEDLKVRTRELAEFVASAALQYGFASDSVTAVGFSNGANIAGSLMLLSPDVLHRAVLLSPMTPLTPDTSPDLNGKSVFIGAGSRDPIAPPSEVNRLSSLLKGYGASVSEYFHAGGHTVTEDEVKAAHDWLSFS